MCIIVRLPHPIPLSKTKIRLPKNHRTNQPDEPEPDLLPDHNLISPNPSQHHQPPTTMKTQSHTFHKHPVCPHSTTFHTINSNPLSSICDIQNPNLPQNSLFLSPQLISLSAFLYTRPKNYHNLNDDLFPSVWWTNVQFSNWSLPPPDHHITWPNRRHRRRWWLLIPYFKTHSPSSSDSSLSPNLYFNYRLLCARL